MRPTIGFACLLAAFAGLAPLRVSATELGRLDPARSLAEFSLRVLWVRRIEGRFEFIQGGVARSASPDRIDIDVAIAAQSLDMRNPEHAVWARSREFFDAGRHPWIRFQVRQAPAQLLQDGGVLSGDLSLRGITRLTEFELLPAQCPRPGIDCAVHARGEIRRSDFGMDTRRWAVGDKVQLALRFHLRDEGGS